MEQKINRRMFNTSLGLGALSMAIPRALSAEKKPNIVLILVDDLGWVDTGCYGSTYYETPHIDRLASQGMRFTNGYAACAVCSPTRAAIMTGRYPARLGVTDWIRSRFQGGEIPEDKQNPSGYVGTKNQKLLCPENALWMELDEITIAEMLKPVGYTSCHIGKWHLGADDWYPDKQGFDYNIGGCDFGQPPSYFDPYCNKNQGCIETLEPREEGEYLTDREADEAVHFINQHKDKPFFLYMAHYAVHTPIQAKDELIKKYNEKEKTHQKDPVYAAMVESVDDAVGRIMQALDENGIAENTLVIFTSDNGGLMGKTSNLPLRAGKGYPYEGGIREPIIIRWPGVIEAGSTCDVPVTSVDYFPTLCEAAGVNLPADRPTDGESIMPLLKQNGELQRDAIFWHFPHYRGNITPYGIIRKGDWKLLMHYDGEPSELYNLKEDLSEENDIAPKMPEKVKELEEHLHQWLKETNAKMPKKNPDYEETADS